ncbi:MAG: response regulator, partial [Woeseia sp.]
VDDHAAVIRVLRLGIEQGGYAVDSASDGIECLAMLEKGHPDFLVTDIDMPRMTGKDLCAAIAERYPDRQFPIVVLTSRSELEHRDWTANIENLEFMEKPVSVRQLLAHIASSLKLTTEAGVA